MSDGSPACECCKCCTKFILTLGLLALFIWLSLRTTKPSYSIKHFSLPALNKTTNSTSTRSNHTLLFTLHFNNKMKDKGVKYSDLHLSFFYGPNTSFPIANATVPGFYQGHGKKADKSGAVETRGVPWEAALNQSNPVFRVDLVARVRYKILFWFTKGHDFVVRNTTVEVNDSGKKSESPPPPRSRSCIAATTFSLVLFVLL
ncbi:PREDICTED: protein NDR1-like [Ipomoea nil]|uniref:protein NDR1-like n=1 Tax=Ipomoea nil TaxID=35883 RepID=UPI000901C732|nr:PREDICTED: protein NDR1-like [Ipomoea nil]